MAKRSGAAAKGRAKPKARAAKGAVRVRMYRQGLGDCFLLTFRAADGRPFFMLIDCGVILGTKEPDKVMTAVAEDIRQRTGGHIHVAVATHEHWDHLSGFVQAQSVFEQITIDTVWLAWTEDPKDPLAKSLRAGRRQALQALHQAVAYMKEADPASETPGQVEEVLGRSGGRVVSLSEEQIAHAWRSLALEEGVFCEPASAAGPVALTVNAPITSFA